MRCQSCDFLEFRGMSVINKDGKTYKFYRFENSEGVPYEMIGFDVDGESSLNRGDLYTIMIQIGRRGNVSLVGVQPA